MSGQEFLFLMYVAAVGFMVGYDRGTSHAEKRQARFVELGRWVADAIAGVRDSHRFTGDEITTTSRGVAKLSNGERYVLTVQMDRP